MVTTKQIKKIKGIYLVNRWTEELDYQVAAYGVSEDGQVFESSSFEFRNKKDLKNAKFEALDNLMEENDEIDFIIENLFQGRLKASNLDGSKIKIVYKDCSGQDLRAGYPTDEIVKYYLGLGEI